jgi:hypothetical protein
MPSPQMSSIFGPSTLQNWQNRQPQWGNQPSQPTQQGQGGFSQQLSNWMQQNPVAYGGQQSTPPSQFFSQSPQNAQMGGAHPGGVRAGDFLSEAFMRDWFNQAGARDQMRNMMGGFVNNMQSVPAMGMMGVDMARQSGQQGMNVAREGMERMMGQAGLAQTQANQTRQDVRSSLGSARGKMQEGIDTMQGAITKRENEGIADISGGVAGIQQQFASERQRINSDPSMTDEERQVALDNLNNGMRQQSAMYAGQAQRGIDDSLASMRTALSGMQGQMGSTMGALGLQGAGLTSQAGMQAAGMGLQAAQAGYQMMNAQSQFAGSLAQSAMAQAIQATIAGNTAAAQMAMEMPLGTPNIADTILAMINAQGMRPGNMASGPFAGRLSGLLGQQGFQGYAEQGRQPSQQQVQNNPFRIFQ